MHYFKNITYALIASLLLFSACGEDEDPEPVGNAPVANAGADLDARANSSVTLDGTGSSDAEGALTYAWALTTRPDGSSASINNATQATATFTPDVVGTYVATLTVTDTDSNNASDVTTITVTEAVGSPPVAVIVDENDDPISEDRSNNTVTVTSPYALDGSQSSDPDGDALTYAWTIASEPSGSAAATISGNSQAETTFTPDVVGEYVIRLTVSDPSGNENSAEVTLVANVEPVLINSNITADRTLENIFEDPTLPDYRVTRSIVASAVLTVEPGVVVEFVEDAFLTVASGGGALIADGEASEKITFTTANLAGGIRWGGIYFSSQDSRNIFDNVIISYGGNSNMTSFADFVDVPANIGLGEGARLKLTNTQVSNGGGYGMYVRYGELTEFSGNAFDDNTRSGIGLTITEASVIDNATTFADNTLGAVEIFGSTVSEDITVEALSDNAYYFVSGGLTMAADVTVTAGTELRMAEDVFITVTDDGALIAEGTATDRIIFTAQDEDNPWGGIKMASTDSKNKLDYATVTKAGSVNIIEFANFVDVPANIGMYGEARLSITNTIVSESGGYGMYVRFGELISFENNTFTQNARTGINLAANQVNAIDINSSFTDNVQGAVGIFGSTLNDETSEWVALKDDARYLVTGNLDIQRSLTIQPGAKFDFQNDVFFTVTESGSLIAEGTATSTIVFTSADPSAYKWRGIFISAGTINNKLDYVEVSHGGSSKYDFASFVDANVNVGVGAGATVAITNSTITNSGSYGIYADGTVNADVETTAGNTFSDNPDGNVLN
ncbi:MAG: PKD domain-containing protein [Tunicatimonas sp.]